MREHHHDHRRLRGWTRRTRRNRTSTTRPEELPHLPMPNPTRHHPPTRCSTWSRDSRAYQTSRDRRTRSIHHTKIEGVHWPAACTRPNARHDLRLDRMPHPIRPMPSRSRHTMAPHPKHLRQQRRTPVRQTTGTKNAATAPGKTPTATGTSNAPTAPPSHPPPDQSPTRGRCSAQPSRVTNASLSASTSPSSDR